MGNMPYTKFLGNSIVGALLWVGLFVFGGFFFGQLPWVKANFSLAFLAMAAISAVPLAYEIIKAKQEAKAELKAKD